MRSSDGVTWADITSLPPSDGLVCLNGRFVGFSGVSIWFSDSGSSATTAFAPTASDNFAPIEIAFGNSTWVVASSTGALHYSTDNAATWHSAVSPAGELKTLAFGSGTFLATDGGYGLMTSPNGIDWTVRPAPSVVASYPIVYAAGRFQSPWAYSTNGTSWVENNGNPAGNIVAGTTGFLAFNGKTFYTSTTGAWTATQAPIIGDNITAAGLCGNLWVAGTYNGKILTSPTPALPPPAAPPLSVAPALRLSWNSQIGRTYIIQRSTNQTTWTDHTGLMVGTGATMEWLAPASSSKEFFRVQVR